MKLIKIGGSVITDKKSYKKPVQEKINKMARTLADYWKKGNRDIVVVHGAGSFGHAPVLKHEIDKGIKNNAHRLGYADTHAACSELSLLLVKALISEEIPAISISPSTLIEQENKRIKKFNTTIVYNYLDQGYLPVLYGDMVPDSTLNGSVCSGDQIMSWLGKKADVLIFVTDVDGVLDDKGKVITEINKHNFTDVSVHLKKTKNDVTGAMKGKIKELLDLERKTYIVNGNYPDRLISLLEGKKAISTKLSGD